MEHEDYWDWKKSQNVVEGLGLTTSFVGALASHISTFVSSMQAEHLKRKTARQDVSDLLALASSFQKTFLAIREQGVNTIKSTYLAGVLALQELSKAAEDDPDIAALFSGEKEKEMKNDINLARRNFEMAESYLLRTLGGPLNALETLIQSMKK